MMTKPSHELASLWEAAVETNPNSSTSHMSYAQQLWAPCRFGMQGNKSVFYQQPHCSYANVTTALESTKAAVELNPGYAEAYFNLGAMYQNLKMSWEAVKRHF